jgi:hypothetical protein
MCLNINSNVSKLKDLKIYTIISTFNDLHFVLRIITNILIYFIDIKFVLMRYFITIY